MEKGEKMKLFLLSIFSLIFFTSCVSMNLSKPETGNDLLAKFQEADEGQPLRCVVIGGSITQAGKGWIGDWLRETFPKANVVMHNAGKSATGSMLGMFRLDRDVISCQPDVVFIEFAVNDGGADDEAVYWTVESIVRRLKTLPDPPAIVFIETAARNKSKRFRHAKVAEYYGLLDIDLQLKTDAYLKAKNLKWDELFGDAVHPNEKGHQFYSRAIAEDLQPFADKAKQQVAITYNLPKQFSSKKLILDGRMVPIAVAPGWHEESSLPFWWDKFFNGVVASKEPGTTMQIPFRGTIAGLFFPLDKKYGMFYANIDGNGFKEIKCNNRGGYTYTVFKDLTPDQHYLNIALPLKGEQGEGVKLGFLLLGGETGAKNTIAPQGEFSPEKLANFALEPIKASQWHWIGPFGDVSQKWADDEKLPNLKEVFPPESGKVDLNQNFAVGNKILKWQPVTSDAIDFGKFTGFKDRGICYATTTISSPKYEKVSFAFRVDYWGKIWINGKLVLTVDKGHGGPSSPIFFEADLKKGDNTILVKVYSGSLGNCFSLERFSQ